MIMSEPLYGALPKACEISGFKDYFIRKLCKQGKIKYKLCGNKYYINLASLIAYCEGDEK